MASGAYLDRAGRPANPQELTNHSILVMGQVAPLTTWRLRSHAGAVSEIIAKPVVISNESVTLIRQAVNGAGIALVSTHLIARHLAQGELEIILPQWRRANDMQISAVFPRRATSERKVRAFVDFAMEVFATWRIPSGVVEDSEGVDLAL